MAVKKELIIEISPTGAVSITPRNIKGSDCGGEVKPIAISIGKIKSETHTKEFYERSSSPKGKVSTKAK